MKGNILNLVLKILSTVALVITSLLSIATAYIVFAPDTMWKPFYLVYAYPGDEVTQTSGEGETTTTDHGTTTQPTAAPAKPSTAKTPVTVKVNVGQGIMVPMGSQIINLSDPAGKRYVRVSAVLEFSPEVAYFSMGEEEKKAYLTTFNAEIEPKKAVINDVIINTLSTKTYQNLYTTEGKEAVKKEILSKVNERLPGNEVIAVYFTEFVVD